MSGKAEIWPRIETSGRRIGYARVSTKDQKLRMQEDALTAVACEHIYADHGISGAKANRPELDAMLKALMPGDTVIVFKLDRLGRSVQHLSDLLVRFREDDIGLVSLSEGINTTVSGGKLVFYIFSIIAEVQRDFIVEGTLAGLEAARQRGVPLGRPRLLDPQTVAEAHRHMRQYGTKPGELAQRLGVSQMTLNRAIKRLELDEAA